MKTLLNIVAVITILAAIALVVSSIIMIVSAKLSFSSAFIAIACVIAFAGFATSMTLSALKDAKED